MANADGDITLKIGVVADDARKVASDLHKYMEKTLNKPFDTKAFDGIKKTITETAAKSEKLGEELRTLKSTGADLGFNEQFKQLSESASIAQKKYFALRREAKAMRQAGNIPGAEELEKQVAIADAQRRQLLSQRMTLANTGRTAGSDEFGEKTVQLTELNNQMVLYIKQLERMRSLEATRKQVASATQGPEKATPKKGLSETEDKARVLTESIEQLRQKLEGTDKSIGFLKLDKSIQKTIDDTNALKSTFEQMRAEVYKVTPTEEFARASAKVKTLQQDVEKYHAKLMELEEMGKTHTQPYTDTVFKWNQAQNSLITQLQLMRQMTAAGEDYNRVLWTETEEYNAAIAKQRDLNRDLEIGKQKLKESAEYKAYVDKHVSTPQDVKKEGEEAQQTSEKLNELEGQKKRTTRANSELGEESEETASKMRQEKSAAERLKETFVTFGRGVKTIGKGMVTVAKATGNFVNRLRGVHKGTDDASKSLKNLLKFSLKYFLGLRSIFILYKRIRSAGVEAYKGLASQFPELQAEVNELKNSFFQLKNSLATMAQPIVSALVPAIKTLMGWLSAAMTALANFFAILTGAKYVYKASKANKDWAKSASGAGKAAKEANEDIAEYDNLILIQQDKDSGGGGGGAADDYAGAFEKVKAESDLAKEIKDAIEKGDWEGVGKALAKRLNNVVARVDTWIQTMRPKAKKWASNIARIMNGLTSEFDAKKLGKTLSHGLMSVMDTISTFWETYNWKTLGQRIGDAITNFFTEWEPDTVARFFAKKFNALSKLISGIVERTDFAEVGKKLGETFKKLFTEKIKWRELATNVGNLIRGIFTSIKEFITTSDLGNSIATAINELLAGINFSGLMGDMAKVANSLVSALGTAIANTNWDEIGDGLATLITGIDWTEVFKTIVISAQKLLGVAQKIIFAIADAICNIDWGEVAEAICDLLKSIDWGKLLSSLVKVALNLIAGLAEALLTIATDPQALLSLGTAFATIFAAKSIWGAVKGAIGGGLSGAITGAAGGINWGLLGKGVAVVASYKLGTKIGAELGKAIFGPAFEEEYNKMLDHPVQYTIDAVKTIKAAASETSELTGGTTLGNAWKDLWSGGEYTNKKLQETLEEQHKIQDYYYQQYLDMVEKRYKEGKKIRDADKQTLIELGRISDDSVAKFQTNANHYADIARKQAGAVSSAQQEAINSSNHYAQIAQENAKKHVDSKAAMEQASNHYAEIAKANAGVVSESQKAMEEASNHYVIIAQQNAQKNVKTDNDMITSSNHYADIAKANAEKVSTESTTMATNIQNSVKGIPSEFDNTFTTAYDKITNAFSATDTFFSGVASGIKSPFSTMADYFKNTFTDSWNGVTNVFKTNSPQFQSIQDSVSTVFKGSINSMITGINNTLVSPFSTLSSIFSKMKNFDINGTKVFSSLPSFSVPKIPKLAQGAVLPPNQPFLAMVGDQKQGTNVETPLSTMIEAFREAMQDYGGNNNQPIVLTINGRQVAQAVWDEENKRYKQTGQRYRYS